MLACARTMEWSGGMRSMAGQALGGMAGARAVAGSVRRASSEADYVDKANVRRARPHVNPLAEVFLRSVGAPSVADFRQNAVAVQCGSEHRQTPAGGDASVSGHGYVLAEPSLGRVRALLQQLGVGGGGLSERSLSADDRRAVSDVVEDCDILWRDRRLKPAEDENAMQVAWAVTPVQEWAWQPELFGDPDRPLHIDFGCGDGEFLAGQATPQLRSGAAGSGSPPAGLWNHLGLDVRDSCVLKGFETACDVMDSIAADGGTDVAEVRARLLADPCIHYMLAQANIALPHLVASLPTGSLQRASFLFPDPWFKKKHTKRRIINPTMVQMLADYMPSRSMVLLQTDVPDLHEDFVKVFGPFGDEFEAADAQLLRRFRPATKRALLCASRGQPVYTAIYTRR